MSNESTHPFVTYLESLRDGPDARAALANLRRGLGQEPGTVITMYPYVVPRLPLSPKPWEETCYYLIASLFAYHPETGGTGNLAEAFRQAAQNVSDTTAIERRFVALLASHPDDLPFYLRQAVSFLKSKKIPINWHQLMIDVLAWGHPENYVQKRWARDFWRNV